MVLHQSRAAIQKEIFRRRRALEFHPSSDRVGCLDFVAVEAGSDSALHIVLGDDDDDPLEKADLAGSNVLDGRKSSFIYRHVFGTHVAKKFGQEKREVLT